MFGTSLYEFVLVAFAMWLIYGVVIACINPGDAAKIIKATGLYFPIRLPRWLQRTHRR